LSGTNCERTLTQNIDYYCGTGAQELNANECYNEEATASVGNCPTGYSLNDETGACETTDSQPVVYSCPTEGGKYTLQGTECLYADMLAAQTQCEGGATISDDGASCQLEIVDEAIPSCGQEGFIPLVADNRCMMEERVPFGQ
jgi:hypothetical protein